MSILNFVFEEKHIPNKPVGTKITHSSGKTYIKESTGWYNTETGNKLDYKSTLILESGSNEEVKDSGKEEDTTSTEQEPTADKGTSESESPSIPNGYVYTSGKGNKFIFKNGTWFNAATKKPVNQSNVNMLNRSAAKAITDFNSKNDIKIGAKVTSNKGTEYTFNGTGFVSADGKQLSGGAAQSAMTKLKAQNDSNSSSTDEQQPDDSTKQEDSTIVPGESALDTQSDSQSTSSTSDNPEQSSDYNAQSIIDNLGDQESGNNSDTENNTSTSDVPPAPQNNSSNNEDPLTKLAQEIKSSKYNKQIVTLLSRGSDVDLIAAEILLKGNVQEVVNQLKSLNNSNTQ